MSTAQLDRAAPAVAPAPGGVLHRVRRLRHTSPGRLQLILAVLLTLGALTGLVAGITAAAARTGTDDLGERAQPLLVEAETIYSALADADTTAAQAFLAGGLEPAELTRRYEADLHRATTALTSAARRTAPGGPAAEAISALSADIPRYAALVASARANNRQGLPVGASYLSTASRLSRESLQPQAQALFRSAQREVDAGYSDARSSWWTALLVVLLLTLLVTLLLAQRHLSRATRRTFNLPLLAATGVTLLLALTTAAVLAGQRARLADARTDGSRPVAMLAEARILALRERGDEALTLAARAGEGAQEKDFDETSRQLTGLLADIRRQSGAATSAAVTAATEGHRDYVAAHDEVRALDNSGRYDDAVELAIGEPTTRTFTVLTDGLGRGLEDRKADFTREIDDAGRGLGSLTVLGPLLALVLCVLAAAGIRARLEEYR
ncbi:hypothetical protein [Pseudosporangium ferrugineum]|uniref:Secreted protein n=1 Tax=Pseudosporangium ferrugineum TaxID=439699 RepID=A0A2T0SJH4_9ACTN|nr:hypothetical protein [Pseudosporangium ferrugineum]PRY33567.1 hypothetical protein CLV70_101730 [Pseudosporangium ferrugineum]